MIILNVQILVSLYITIFAFCFSKSLTAIYRHSCNCMKISREKEFFFLYRTRVKNRQEKNFIMMEKLKAHKEERNKKSRRGIESVHLVWNET